MNNRYVSKARLRESMKLLWTYIKENPYEYY